MSEKLQIVEALVYRLNTPDGNNIEEINVTMWNGSRKESDRAEGARRVLSCVNACAGLSTEVLENILMLGDTLKSRIDENIRQINLLTEHEETYDCPIHGNTGESSCPRC